MANSQLDSLMSVLCSVMLMLLLLVFLIQDYIYGAIDLYIINGDKEALRGFCYKLESPTLLFIL